MFSCTFVLVAETSFTHCYISALILTGRCYEAEMKFAPFCSLGGALSLYHFVKIFRFRPKTMDYSQVF